MNQLEALAVLRRTLEAFHGERETIVRANRLSASGPIRMVARLTSAQLAEAVSALAALERETPEESP